MSLGTAAVVETLKYAESISFLLWVWIRRFGFEFNKQIETSDMLNVSYKQKSKSTEKRVWHPNEKLWFRIRDSKSLQIQSTQKVTTKKG